MHCTCSLVLVHKCCCIWHCILMEFRMHEHFFCVFVNLEFGLAAVLSRVSAAALEPSRENHEQQPA